MSNDFFNKKKEKDKGKGRSWSILSVITFGCFVCAFLLFVGKMWFVMDERDYDEKVSTAVTEKVEEPVAHAEESSKPVTTKDVVNKGSKEVSVKDIHYSPYKPLDYIAGLDGVKYMGAIGDVSLFKEYSLILLVNGEQVFIPSLTEKLKIQNKTIVIGEYDEKNGIVELSVME